MGSFSCPAPVLMIRSNFGGDSSSFNLVSFRTTHMEDPWILPSPSPSNVPVEMDVSLPATMIAYQTNLDCVAEPSPSSSWMEEEDPYVLLARAVQYSHAHDYLDTVFPSDETIIEAMSRVEPPWEVLSQELVSSNFMFDCHFYFSLHICLSLLFYLLWKFLDF